MSKWPKIPAGIVRSVLAAHSSLGIAFAALIYLVCFSGTVAVLVYEWQRWEKPQNPVVTETTPQVIANAVRLGLGQGDSPDTVFVVPPQWDLPRLTVSFRGTGGERNLAFTAEGKPAGFSDTPFAKFLAHLHTRLHLGKTWGFIMVGLSGVALLSLLISGLIAHPRIFRDAFFLRLGGSRRLQESDLHNRIGVWALPFHLTISLTGALLGLSTLILAILALAVFKGDMSKAYALFQPPFPKVDARPAPLPDLETMLKTTQALAPLSSIGFVTLQRPGTQGQSVMIEARTTGTLARGQQYLFDGKGKLLQNPLKKEPLGTVIIASLSPLHYGWFGGGVIKIAYVALGALLTWLTSTGITIWLARKRDKGHSVSRWERIWTAFSWSQPVAYAGTAIAVLATLPPVASWISLTVACLLTASIWNAETLFKILRGLSALLLAALAVTHIAVWHAAFGDPMAWIIDGVLLALALAIGFGLRRQLSSLMNIRRRYWRPQYPVS